MRQKQSDSGAFAGVASMPEQSEAELRQRRKLWRSHNEMTSCFRLLSDYARTVT
jgi:hypothetical protein